MVWDFGQHEILNICSHFLTSRALKQKKKNYFKTAKMDIFFILWLVSHIFVHHFKLYVSFVVKFVVRSGKHKTVSCLFL